MEIISLTSKDIKESQWISYVESFNEVFNKFFTVDTFKKKYLNTIKSYSLHAFLMDDNDKVMGAVTVIPYQYSINGHKEIIGVAVDAFVSTRFRKDPLLLKKMYLVLKERLISEELNYVLCVPNDTAYPYWKKIVKWKDIGRLPYYAIPIRIGNVIKKFRWLNILSLFGCKILFAFQDFINFFIKNVDSGLKIEIDKSVSCFEEQRYGEEHSKVILKNCTCFYRNMLEEGVNTVYLIDFYNQEGERDAKSLNRALKYIYKTEKADLIVFVGPLMISQIGLLRVPEKFEPKPLYFMCDILSNGIAENDILSMKSWDFGLLNYDVR